MSVKNLAPRLERRSFAPGREIFAQGEAGDCAYLVESGAVTIYQHLDGRRIELGIVRQGEIFGEMAAIDGGPRMASAVATERTEATRIPKEVFDRKLNEADRFVRVILNFFIRTVRSGHQTFLRRPRSVPDHLRMLEMMSSDLHAFHKHVDQPEAAQELEEALSELDQVIQKVARAAERCPDKRHNMISDEEELRLSGTFA